MLINSLWQEQSKLEVFVAKALMPVFSGADAVLLIAAVLPNKDLEYFTKSAKNLGMQCLIEVPDTNG